jgi:hypothetical protein
MFFLYHSHRCAEEKAKGEWNAFSSVGGFPYLGTPGKKGILKVTNSLSLFADGSTNFLSPRGSPLACLLKYWKNFDPKNQ